MAIVTQRQDLPTYSGVGRTNEAQLVQRRNNEVKRLNDVSRLVYAHNIDAPFTGRERATMVRVLTLVPMFGFPNAAAAVTRYFDTEDVGDPFVALAWSTGSTGESMDPQFSINLANARPLIAPGQQWPAYLRRIRPPDGTTVREFWIMDVHPIKVCP